MPETRMYCPFNLDIPRMGDIILYKHRGGFIGDGIRLMQLNAGFSQESASFTHVEMSGGGQWAVDVAPPRIKVTDIRTHHSGQFARIVRFKQPLGMDDVCYWRKQAKIAFWSATKSNLAYDFGGVLSFVFKFIKQAKNQNFCSENILWSLQQEYETAPAMKPEEYMPAHATDEKYFYIVWEGIIPDINGITDRK
jgi:hypothetical protein